GPATPRSPLLVARPPLPPAPRASSVAVPAPRHYVHPERLPDAGDLRPQPSQTDHAEAVPVEVSPDRLLPAAVPDGSVLDRNAAQHRQDQTPGQLRCRRGGRLGSAHHDPLRTC